MSVRCPDCQTTIRASAKLLQQAGGRVHCDGCGNAFDVLEGLSDDEQAEQTEVPARRDIEKELAGSRTEEDIEPERPEHVVPPQTEEEMTVNQQIDEELLRATQTLDVFASAKSESQNVSQIFGEDSPMAETIVMEGETIHSTLQGDRRKSDRNGSEVNFPEWMKDTYLLNKGANRDHRQAGDPPRDSSGNWSGFTAIVSFVLVILFLFWQIIR
jgi:predicted Zn finger-like uncharacterized protein